MNIKKCDRCGGLKGGEPVKITGAWGYAKAAVEALVAAIHPTPIYRLYLKETELDLCDDCQKKLRDWFENPNGDEDPETEVWSSYDGRKTIKAPKGTFEAIYNDTDEEEMQHGDDDF